MESGPKNFDILTLMSQRLQNLGLITNDEKLKLGQGGRSIETKNAIFDMLLEKDVATASKMFLAIRSVKLENDGSQNPCATISNPMRTFTIIKRVLGFLNLSDVKNCRLIDKSWNSVAEPLLRKRSKIEFGSYVFNNAIEPIRSPAKFFETYARSSITQSFSSFQFDNYIDFQLSDLKNFFAQQKKNIKELAFHNIKLVDEKGKALENYDISDWLVGSPLTKLDIRLYRTNHTMLTFSFDKLHLVNDINLRNCGVMIPKGYRISPISFNIHDVKWQLESGARANIDELRLDNVIDFHKATDIQINAFVGGPKLIFDISECVDLKSLVLCNNVTVINWNRAKATVDCFYMTGIPFLEKTEMKINKLFFRDSSIDLFNLPWAIEELYVGGRGGGLTVSCSLSITLPNLKKITCKDNRQAQARLLTNFVSCANLVDIHVTGFANEDAILNTSWIPKSVKRIKVKKVKVIGSKLNLETLVLKRYSLLEAAQILKTIKPKVLVLSWNVNFEANDSVLGFIKQFKDLVLYMGPFNWEGERDSDGEEDPKYETSRLATYVDEQATYYAFENNRGKAIEEDSFDAFFKLG